MPAPSDVTVSPDRDAPAHPTAILAIICISYFMVILDNSIIFTGLPRIESAMQFTPTGLTWVQDAYTLVFGGLLLLGARAGDILGRRRAFMAGFQTFSCIRVKCSARSSWTRHRATRTTSESVKRGSKPVFTSKRWSKSLTCRSLNVPDCDAASRSWERAMKES